jgi:hypothetical protein
MLKSAVLRVLAISGDFGSVVQTGRVGIDVVPTYGLTTTAVGQGRVVRRPSNARLLQDEVVRVEAVPAVGWRFLKWEGDVTGSAGERDLVMSRDQSVRAVFEPIPQHLVTVTGPGGTTSGSGTYYEGSTVKLDAPAQAGWEFMGWSGDYGGKETSFSWVVSGPATFRAVFGTRVDRLVVGGGQVVLEPKQALYAYGSLVKVTPLPDAGYYLGLWGEAGKGKPRTEWTYTVAQPQPRITALFQV